MSKDSNEKLLDLVCAELDKIATKPALDNATINMLDTLIDIKKDILEVMVMEGAGNQNYSMMNGSSYGTRMMPSGIPTSYYGHDRGYWIQPVYNHGYSREGGQRDMIDYLNSMAESMPQHKREMTYDFIRRLESVQ